MAGLDYSSLLGGGSNLFRHSGDRIIQDVIQDNTKVIWFDCIRIGEITGEGD